MMSILQNTTNVHLTKFEAFERRQDEQITKLYQQLQRQGISINLPSDDATNIDEAARTKVGDHQGDATNQEDPP
jgi:hypothetical protein